MRSLDSVPYSREFIKGGGGLIKHTYNDGSVKYNFKITRNGKLITIDPTSKEEAIKQLNEAKKIPTGKGVIQLQSENKLLEDKKFKENIKKLEEDINQNYKDKGYFHRQTLIEKYADPFKTKEGTTSVQGRQLKGGVISTQYRAIANKINELTKGLKNLKNKNIENALDDYLEITKERDLKRGELSKIAYNNDINPQQLGGNAKEIGILKKIPIEGKETTTKKAQEARNIQLKKTSSLTFEGRLVRIKKKEDLDLAHRVAKNITQTTNTLGLDSPIINQVIVKPSEELINDYYKTQKIIGKKILREGQTPELLKKLDDINSKIFAESLRTKGRVVGSILLPDKTGGLVSELVGVNPKLSIDFGIFDQDIKSLEKEIGFKKFRGVKIGTPEFFEKLKMSGGNIEKANLFYNEILPSVLEYNKMNPLDPNDFKDLLNTKERQASVLKAASKYRSDLVPTLKNIFKKIPLSSATKLGGLGLVGLTTINATPSKAMTTAQTDQVTEGQAPEPKLAENISYNTYSGFVKADKPEEKASQSDLLYWIADNEIMEDVKEIGKTVGEIGATIGGATVGLGLPDVKKTVEEAKAAGKSPVKSVLGKGFYRLGSPFATAAFTIPQALDEKVTATEMATDPLNYLGLATMETLGKRAGTIAAPAVAESSGILGALKNYATLKNVGEAVPGKLNAALRLGLSPRVIAGASRFLGIPGLIASGAYTLYDYLSNKESE